MTSVRRPTVRGRLALLITAVIVVTGASLLAISYLLVKANLSNPGLAPTTTTVVSGGAGVGSVRSAGTGRLPDAAVTIASRIARHTLAALLTQFGAVLVVLAAIAGVVAWLIAGRVLSPLRAITRTARGITHHHLHERIGLVGPDDELKDLGDTFDAMLARLEVSFTDQQLFAANAAHELRTPFAVMRAELDLAIGDHALSTVELRQMAARVRRTVMGCEQLTDRLLSLTKGSMLQSEHRLLQLGDVVRLRAAVHRPAAEQRHLDLRLQTGPAPVSGDQALVAVLIDNLLDNAIKYNQDGGWIGVSTRVAGNWSELVIVNRGLRITDDELPGLLEPFRRVGQRIGNSTGLGLSIVRAITDAHDGQLSLHSVSGGGLKVRVLLPSATADSSVGPIEALSAQLDSVTNSR